MNSALRGKQKTDRPPERLATQCLARVPHQVVSSIPKCDYFLHVVMCMCVYNVTYVPVCAGMRVRASTHGETRYSTTMKPRDYSTQCHALAWLQHQIAVVCFSRARMAPAPNSCGLLSPHRLQLRETLLTAVLSLRHASQWHASRALCIVTRKYVREACAPLRLLAAESYMACIMHMIRLHQLPQAWCILSCPPTFAGTGQDVK